MEIVWREVPAEARALNQPDATAIAIVHGGPVRVRNEEEDSDSVVKPER